jgi:hypothetical protein
MLLVATGARGEQMQRLGEHEVHYIVLPSTTLNASVAHRYGLERARNLALVNVSVLVSDGLGVPVGITGTARNLLGQTTALEFREVREDAAVYYLATLHYTDRDMFSFTISIEANGAPARTLEFRQTLYAED